MKIWKEFGSSHSANITIIGEFEDEKSAKIAFDAVEDIVNGSWEERHESGEKLTQHWRDKGIKNFPYISEEEYELGLENNADVDMDGKVVKISRFYTYNVNGILKVILAFNLKCFRINKI
jgi:hypothetical protein